MRALLFVALFAAALTHAAWNDYIEVRDLRIDAGSLETLVIETGAGPLTVRGDRGIDDIVVEATITAANKDEDKARELIESDLRLSLDRDGNAAVLIGRFDRGSWRWGDSPRPRAGRPRTVSPRARRGGWFRVGGHRRNRWRRSSR